jgi:hypothetical protein
VTEEPSAVYVYGVMPADELGGIAVTGVEDAEIRPVQHGGLAALTSAIRGEALQAANEVRAHWRVLEEATTTATVLPTRFGTVMESEEAVRERLLAPNAERLEELLRAVAGRVQLNVKGDYDEPSLMREIVSSSPGIAALRDRLSGLPDEAGYYERIRLGELVAAEVQRRREADTQLAIDALGPLAVEAKEEEPSRQEAAFNLAFLVERDRRDQFTEGVNGLVAKLGDRVEIRYVGPLPPYSFAGADLNAGSEAWA